jgi:hypothetical protein
MNDTGGLRSEKMQWFVIHFAFMEFKAEGHQTWKPKLPSELYSSLLC